MNINLNVGLIGYGYWGVNLLRNLIATPNCNVVRVCDARTERLEQAKRLYGNVDFTSNYEDICFSNDIDAVVIATPVFSHFKLAKAALEAGKHVLIEKPMTSSVAEAEELINIALSKNLVLMVDHTFLYTSAVSKIKSLVDSGEIGRPQYLDSTRINLGLFQSDVNVLWDLAPHDISILLYLIAEKPYSINATGKSHTRNNLENIAFMTVNYESDFVAHFSCSWTSPVKVRQTLIGGDKKMIVYNDLEPSEKIRIYDTTYIVQNDEDKNRILVDYRVGDVFLPKLENKEALAALSADFINAILHHVEPISNYHYGLNVVKILEAAQASIKDNGREYKI